MPTVPEHSLNYQPNTEPYSYAPFKMSILKRVIISLAKLSPFIFAFLAIFTVIIVFINYFNIISLSYLYPQFFSSLPHKYDITANKAALVGVPYDAYSEDYQIDGKLYKIKNNTILIEYNGKVAEFILGPKLACNYKTVRKISKTVEETNYEPAFCSDILIDKNIGRNISVIYYRASQKYNLINNISLE